MANLDFSRLKALILDMDGVLWRGNEPIGDLPGIFARIAERGWGVCLATNNATRSPEQYVERFAEVGVTLTSSQVVNSAQVAAHYLSSRFPQGGPVFIIGEDGLTAALAEKDFYNAEKDVLAVVSAMDRGLTYDKLRIATLLIRSGALFIGTNSDLTFPTPAGLVPGAGSILVALQAATGVAPLVTGKPAPDMYQVALERLGTRPEQSLVVGDRFETDIVGAQAIGCHTALVLTGVTTRAQAQALRPQPDLIAADLTMIVNC